MKSIDEIRDMTKQGLEKQDIISKKQKEITKVKEEIIAKEFEIENKFFIDNCFKDIEKAAASGEGYTNVLYRFPEYLLKLDKKTEDFIEHCLIYFRLLGYNVSYEIRYDCIGKESVVSGAQFEFDWGTDIVINSRLMDSINSNIQSLNGDTGNISDGYHTFDELYYHRCVLFSLICNQNNHIAWKSKKHYTGDMYDDMFIVGVNTQYGQVTYHYNLKYWDMFNVPELENAPEWDGSSPSDCIERMRIWSSNIK